MKALFATSPFPSVEYISLLIRNSETEIERHEFFQKQSNRSRYHILSANGIQTLVIPVVHRSMNKHLIAHTSIHQGSPWQSLHWKAISTAYNRSPFFEYYKDDLKPLFFMKEDLLLNFNCNLLKWILKILNKPLISSFTSSYEKEAPGKNDFRALSNSKTSEVIFPQLFIIKKYNQVFSCKHGFIPNLSVLDLIFNCGNHSENYL